MSRKRRKIFQERYVEIVFQSHTFLEMRIYYADSTPLSPLHKPHLTKSIWWTPPVAHPSSESSRTSVLTPSVVAVIALLAAAFLLVSYYRILARYCTAWQYFWGIRWRRQSGSVGDEESVDFEQAWVVLTHGLDELLIRKIPVFSYKKGEGLTESTECIVCLTEFQEEENLRLLPKCSHAFHVPCVDMWLQTHSNCPLCRANIFRDISATQQQQSSMSDQNSFVAQTDTGIATATSGYASVLSPEQFFEATNTEYVNSGANEGGNEQIKKVNSHANQLSDNDALVFPVGECTPQETRQDLMGMTLAYKRLPFSFLRRSKSTGSYVSMFPEVVNSLVENSTSNTATGSAIPSISPDFKNCFPSLVRQRSLSFCIACDRGTSSNTAVSWLTQVSPSHDVEQENDNLECADNFALGNSRMKTPLISDTISERKSK